MGQHVEEIQMIMDRPSILETIAMENRTLIKALPQSDEYRPSLPSKKKPRIMCKQGAVLPGNTDEGQKMKRDIKNAIESTLQFYSSHRHALKLSDDASGLAILKAIDDKRGQEFQLKYPLEEWFSEICNNAAATHGTQNCLIFARAFLARDQHWNNWMNPDALEGGHIGAKAGTDKEVVWPALNYECIISLLGRCEVPHVCQREMFDPIPRSQYMLTHQLLHRVFAEVKMESCGLPESLVDNEVNRQLCSKMLEEAQIISAYGAPFVFRDLFSEYMAFCGYIGYPNFFREDWLNMLLSWQSKSDYGCFIKDVEGSVFENSDIDVPRIASEKEMKMGETTKEICNSHFTAVSLSALAVAWDYLEDNCDN